MSDFLAALGLRLPIIQAPMAGVSTPQLAAAVSNAGGLGSLGLGASTPQAAEQMLQQAMALSAGPINANLFCHRPAHADAGKQAAWLARLAPQFARFGAELPQRLDEIYASYLKDAASHAMLLKLAPPVVSFHFGLPDAARIADLKARGITLLASVTCLAEAHQAVRAGMDAVIAQGWEAGGHRGCFDENAPDARLGTLVLTRLLVTALDVPVIAAGGIMDGAGIRAALELGAVAAQLGTAFIACPESAANPAYRAALASDAAQNTAMTRVISGRPARCLANDFTAWGEGVSDSDVPDYPIAYDAGKALNSAASAAGNSGFGAQWAGQGAPLSRALSVAELMAALAAEIRG
ncbi:MAG: nitronate monooxygenase [Rhodobacterales bacterium]|nr:MAG: nitronate monooxygenase [Rhodobacterales bacterium]